MEKKKYSSYDEIDRELEMLKIEREISYQKASLSVQQFKENLFPTKQISYLTWLNKNVLSGLAGTVFKTALPFILQWILNRKRGD